MKRTLLLTATLALSAVAIAQAPSPRPGPSTPVTVINTPDQPVPVVGEVEIANTSPLAVTVVPPAASEQVMCSTGITSSGPGTWPPFAGSAGLHCPTGVTAVDIQRVISDPSAFDPFNTPFSSRDYVIYNMLVGIGPAGDSGFANMSAILGMFTQSELDKTLPSPVRITLATQSIYFQGRCGAPGVATTVCGRGIIIIGRPIR
jgi:hypothetical protein